MKRLKFTKSIQLSGIVLSVLLIGGCNISKVPTPQKKELVNDAGDKVTEFDDSRYVRVNIDGVDCIVGAGRYETTTAVTCDWNNKNN